MIRLARLEVRIGHDIVRVRTTNVEAFSVRLGALPEDVRNARQGIVVDGQIIELDDASWGLPDFALGLARAGRAWTVRT